MHWTYDENLQEGSDLEQGDILVPTPELRQILAEVHQYFCDEKYVGFVVATQSCDLVRRKGRLPKARYISIASVRLLKDVLPRLLEQVSGAIVPGLFLASKKVACREFLTRLFNQNETNLGLFYLHPESKIELGQPSVAFLRVKVALQQQHYDVLMRARRGRLGSEFRGKLGWLLGNIYSRAASKDWLEVPGGKKALESMVDKHTTEQIEGEGPRWVDDVLVTAAQAAGVALEGKDHATLLRDLEAHKPKARIERVVDEVIAQAEKVFASTPDDLLLLRRKLMNSGALRQLMKSTK